MQPPTLSSPWNLLYARQAYLVPVNARRNEICSLEPEHSCQEHDLKIADPPDPPLNGRDDAARDVPPYELALGREG